MDRFLAPHTSEALIERMSLWPRSSLILTSFTAKTGSPGIKTIETLVAGCASYQAFNRSLSSSDLFLGILTADGPLAPHDAYCKLHFRTLSILTTMTTCERREYSTPLSPAKEAKKQKKAAKKRNL
ncbi:hypothetical protein JVT61DRAFT_8580 [Boletus reticuloceps]|uniref:Uncharacterized protein n=1 Tax=Boletus reticuloceps TaxID=495285 RepID=A0A8I2YXT2_9AGAM|nr:hypothetical protein JVT61DRAFT_8580 [Boletus reticuloceps]